MKFRLYFASYLQRLTRLLRFHYSIRYKADRYKASVTPTIIALLLILCYCSGCNLLQPDGEKHLINKPKWWDRDVYSESRTNTVK